jgi:hypothetical protein
MVRYYYAITILFVLVFLFNSNITIVYSQLSITNTDDNNQTQNFDNQTLDITTDQFSYGVGQDVKISGILKNNDGLFGSGKVIVSLICYPEEADDSNLTKDIFKMYEEFIHEFFPICEASKTYDNETVFVQNGTFNVNYTETSTSGNYLISAALDSSKNINDSEGIQIVNYFTYLPYMIPFTISFFSIIGLLLSLIIVGILGKPKKNGIFSTFKTLRFIFISGIALSPILLCMITEVGIGFNSPIGLIVQPENKYPFQQNDQHFSQWIIHIGGVQKNDYATGISFPFYIVAFGLLGGYLRYLYKVYEKGEENEEDNSENSKNSKHIKAEIDENSHFLEHTLAELAEIFIAPLLAIAVYFILFQANTQTNPYIAAAISFTLGLITQEVINSLIVFAKGRTGGIKPADDKSNTKPADDKSNTKPADDKSNTKPADDKSNKKSAV